MYKLQLFLVFLGLGFLSAAQSLDFQFEAEDQFGPGISGLTPLVDKLERPYLYVSANEEGLKMYNTNGGLTLVQTLDTIQLGGRVMSLSQQDSMLYVCVGSHFGGSSAPPGITIVDVTDPTSPAVLDTWYGNSPAHGTGVVRLQGDYAYVGGMSEGLIVLNISNPNSISFVSQLVPPIDFPHVNNTQAVVNARGMYIVDTLLYLCYDAGGLRVINIADPSNPDEIGMFANPITVTPWNMPRAYNNVVVAGPYAYVAVDYCGLEIVDVSDPTNMQLVTHWNPHNCPTGQWGDAPIHTNELIHRQDCNLLFISTGKSEMLVVDVFDPLNPIAVDSIGTSLDTTATWGVDITEDEVYLTYLNIPSWIPQILVPFYSDWGGIKKFRYQNCWLGVEENELNNVIVSPNPTQGFIQVESIEGKSRVFVVDMLGRQLYSGEKNGVFTLDVSGFPSGMYILQIENEDGKMQSNFIKE